MSNAHNCQTPRHVRKFKRQKSDGKHGENFIAKIAVELCDWGTCQHSTYIHSLYMCCSYFCSWKVLYMLFLCLRIEKSTNRRFTTHVFFGKTDSSARWTPPIIYSCATREYDKIHRNFCEKEKKYYTIFSPYSQGQLAYHLDSTTYVFVIYHLIEDGTNRRLCEENAVKRVSFISST